MPKHAIAAVTVSGIQEGWTSYLAMGCPIERARTVACSV